MEEGLTITFHALMKYTIEQRTTVVAKRRAAVSVALKFMLGSHILQS